MQKPTLVYAIIASGYIFLKIFCRTQNITYPRASTVAASLTGNEILLEFQKVKNLRG